VSLTPRQLVVLVALTLIWGINWPIIKLGVTGFAPLSFRALSMWLGLPVLGAVMLVLKVPLVIPRAQWRELASLTVTNMIVWHVLAIVSIQALSSGRAAILGYTMPVFSALCGVALFGERLAPRQLAGVAAASVGVALLLWHEFAQLAGRPLGALGMLVAAAVWGLGTQQMRRTRMTVPTLSIAFWMTVLTTLVTTVLALAFEHDRWRPPTPAVWGAIVFNAIAVFGYAQPAWLMLARSLPPVASTLSVMLIPVLGVLSGALWLGETLHWQDGAAMVLMVVAIASVLWPRRRATALSPVRPADGVGQRW
jgi:drug/metabolite transporter (DMT)-like permease